MKKHFLKSMGQYTDENPLSHRIICGICGLPSAGEPSRGWKAVSKFGNAGSTMRKRANTSAMGG